MITWYKYIFQKYVACNFTSIFYFFFFFKLYIHSIYGNDSALRHTYWIHFQICTSSVFGCDKKPSAYKTRTTITPTRLKKNIKPKSDKSKYNTILMMKEKIHAIELHAISQIAFNPILSLWNLVYILKRNKIHISIVQ